MNKAYPTEVADILRNCRDSLVEQKLCSVQRKALDDIIACRTAMAGGHLDVCDQCDYQRPAYNSCRNRHCPKCQYLKQQQWVDRLKGRLMPGTYFHVVFTIPEQLNPLFMYNQGKCYDLLFRAAWLALRQAGANPRFLGGEVGAVAVLHTWGQTLTYHPHIHMIVPGGALSEDGMEWLKAGKKFFVPVKALSGMFRGIMVKDILKLLKEGILKVPDHFPDQVKLKQQLYAKRWHVYSKKAFGGMQSVLNYLGQYTHRVAISNNRLIGIKEGKICFRYRDYAKNNAQRIMQLDIMEFCRRFLQHVLPSGYYKIRYFGILAVANASTKREQAIALIGGAILLPMLEGLYAYEVLRCLTGRDPFKCPKCKTGRLFRKMPLLKPG